MSKKGQGDFKASFSLLELIVIVVLLSSISFIFLKPNPNAQLQQATNRLIIYLKQTRLKSFMQDFNDPDDPLWHKQRWSLKFMRCQSSVGGLYYVIYSDKNKTGHPSANESLKDPLTNKYVYSTNQCSEHSLYSPYVLLTQKYNIVGVDISCNSTSSLGQLSFGVNGEVYSKLSNKENENSEYVLKEPCIVKITHENGAYKEIVIENKTGYIYKNL